MKIGAPQGTAVLLFLSKIYVYDVMSKTIIYAGITVGVIVMGIAIAYATGAQQDRIGADAVPAPANLEGSFSSTSGLGANLNKEQWHEDPFADEAAEVMAKFESGG